jgi:hypothetical protein
MKLSDLQKMAEALRRAGFIPRLIRQPDGTLIAEPADAGLPSATTKSDWD